MSFRIYNRQLLFVAFAILTLLLGQTACDRFLKTSDKKGSEVETANVPINEIACLKKIPENLQNFLVDLGGPKPLTDGIGCVQTALKIFMKYTRGNEPDSFTGKEIQFLFNKYLLQSNQISDSFQKEIIKLKVITVGGTTERVTRAEINLFIQFLDLIQTEGLKLQGKMRLLSMLQTESQVDYAQIQALQNTVQEVAAHILAHTKVADSHYQWVDLISFVHEFHHFVGDSKQFNDLMKWVPVAESVKLLFLAEDDRPLSQKQWENSTRWVIDGYGLVLKFFYEIGPKELATPGQWRSLIRWLDEAFVAVETSPIMKEKRILDAKAMDRMIDEILKLEMFKSPLPAEILKRTYRQVLVHFIDGLPGGTRPGSGDPESVVGLTERHFRILRQEYHAWKLGQTFLNEIFQNNPVVTSKLIVTKAGRMDPTEKIKTFTEDPIYQKELLQSWIDFFGLLNSDYPIVYNDQKKLVINYQPKITPFSFAGANLMNFIYSVTRLTLRGYGDHSSKNLFNNRISQAGLIQFEKDFRELGEKIGFLDYRKLNSAQQTFVETNSFTFHGNGDDWMSPQETFEELNLLVSGGRMQVEQVMVDLEKQRCLTKDVDVFGKRFVDEVCFVRVFRENLKTYFNNMEWMGKFIAELSENNFNEFYRNLKASARLAPPNHVDGRLEYAEVRNMTAILHYIEALMAVYDKDSNNRLSKREVLSAAPRFANLIKMVSPLGDYFVEDIFLCLVYKGKKPTLTDMLLFAGERLAGLGEVDRLNLIKVLGVLKNEMK